MLDVRRDWRFLGCLVLPFEGFRLAFDPTLLPLLLPALCVGLGLLS